MLRLLTAALCATGLIAATACGASNVLHSRHQTEQHTLLQSRYTTLKSERDQWQSSAIDGPAAAGTQTEALRTLDLLQQLYEQEQRLWTYYDAVSRSHTTRSELAAEEAALARRVAEHRQHLERLEHTIDHLRPATDRDQQISFTNP